MNTGVPVSVMTTKADKIEDAFFELLDSLEPDPAIVELIREQIRLE
ncbi:MAG: hypothetical protein QGF00_08690 [Planctomycetota bacterium]|nr:hypothetical protein [Planctomycetota bacterium]MDP7249663.1 hypothetical protein [Planctomycetota bacterium]